MIAEIKKLNMAALLYDRDKLLNVLQKTNAVEIKERAQTEECSAGGSGEELSSYLTSLEAALEILVSAAENAAKDTNGAAPVKDGFAVSYEEFSSAGSKKEEMDKLVCRINSLTDKKNDAAAEQLRISRLIASIKPYKNLRLPFNAYADTLHTKTRLGLFSAPAWDNLEKILGENPLVAYSYEAVEEGVVAAITAHKSVFSDVESLLSEAGFTACPHNFESSGEDRFSLLNAQLAAAREEQALAERDISALSDSVRDLKIYCDYVGFSLEKARAAEKMLGMERTFFLEAFVPAESESAVREALESSGCAIWFEFSKPDENEEIPTLLKNNPVVSNFEAITNMYSPPNAREFDPNTVMAFFYSLFLGFIMGDVGYGLLMLIGGGALWYKSRKGSGLKSLSGVFAVGGIFTIIWGFLFNSLFGMQILPHTVMPSAFDMSNNTFDNYTFIGMQIPAVLVIAMMLGISQLMVGYLCRAYGEWRNGNVLDGIFDGLIWAIFSAGVIIAVSGLVEEFNLPSAFPAVGGIMAGASLLCAALTAGRKEKLVGKFTKGFGAVYGVINYVSDILSYARLYGLMLSGAIIAQIVSKYSIQFITGGNFALIILGVVLMLVGHAFNLAIGLLGAYIHDARLQYVEFYGRFYTGEGELFTPLGSQHRHIYIEG